MARTTQWTIVVVGALVALPAWGQEPGKTPFGPEQAREVAWAFLTREPGAPRLDLARRDLDRAAIRRVEGVLVAHGKTCYEVRYPPDPDSPARFALTISERGQVVLFQSYDRGFVVAHRNADGSPRADAERAGERKVRTLHSPAALRRKAKGFLGRVFPRFRERSFRLRREQEFAQDPVERTFYWEEVPGDGVLAVYPNRIFVSLNPESGLVTGFGCSNVTEQVPADRPPRLGAGGARKRARDERPGHRIVSCELSMILRGGKARPVWIVALEKGESGDLVLVAADDGSLLDGQETRAE